MTHLTIPVDLLSKLEEKPTESIDLILSGVSVRLSICIPHYHQQLQDFYGVNIFPDGPTATQRSGIPFDLQHFGLQLEFSDSVVLSLHNIELELLGDIKPLLARFGTIIIKNAELATEFLNIGHRNRFPHLNFHRDRNETQPTPYSLYTRNPHDQEQRQPRTSSTLFVPNIVAYLQCMKQKDYDQISEKGVKSHYDIFQHEDMDRVIGSIAIEHSWDEPEGTGEISMLDNRTMLHASYMRDGRNQGYRIGVRYLC